MCCWWPVFPSLNLLKRENKKCNNYSSRTTCISFETGMLHFRFTQKFVLLVCFMCTYSHRSPINDLNEGCRNYWLGKKLLLAHNGANTLSTQFCQPQSLAKYQKKENSTNACAQLNCTLVSTCGWNENRVPNICLYKQAYLIDTPITINMLLFLYFAVLLNSTSYWITSMR